MPLFHSETGLAEMYGLFIAEAIAALRPGWLLLSDTDVAPTALFEVAEQATLCKNVMHERLDLGAWHFRGR